MLQISDSDDSNPTESDDGHDNVLNRYDESEYYGRESSDSSASEGSLNNISITSDNFREESGSESDDPIYDDWNDEQIIIHNEPNDHDNQVCLLNTYLNCYFFVCIYQFFI